VADKPILQKESYAKIEAGIIALRTVVDEPETAIRRFVEAKLNEHRNG